MEIYSPSGQVDDILFDMTHHILKNPVGEHGHSCIEIVMIVAGTAVQLLDGARGNLYPGCVTIIHPGCRHGYPETTGCELYNLSCAPDLFQAMGVTLSFLHNREELFRSECRSFQLRLSGLLFHDVRKLLSQMFRIYEEKTPNAHVQLRSRFSMLLLLLAQSWTPQYIRHDLRLADTAEYMEQHFNEKLTLELLARRSGMSRNQFLRKFHQEFDTSPIQYLLELRMRHACALLEESDLTIDQIAAATGFCDSNYFLKLYKRKFGISAGKTRRKNAGSPE